MNPAARRKHVVASATEQNSPEKGQPRQITIYRDLVGKE